MFGLSFLGIWTELITKCMLCVIKCEPLHVSLWSRGKNREGASCEVEMREGVLHGGHAGFTEAVYLKGVNCESHTGRPI